MNGREERKDGVALVTGASRGLGAVIADYLAGSGYRLVITARGEEPLAETAAWLERHRGEVVALAGDVADDGHRSRLAEAVVRMGGLDLLVNNASTLGPTPLPSLVEVAPEALRAVFEVNVLAPLGLVRATLPSLERTGGTIVNLTSDAAVGAYPGWGVYGSSKAALELVSKTLAGELAERGVHSVTVDPGDLRTRMHQEAFPGEDISDRPLPEVTLPFWAWLFSQEPSAVNGRRYRAQAETWEVAA